jgi:hypothetical protein
MSEGAPAGPGEETESIRSWRTGLAEQWGGDPLAEEPEQLETLNAFCEFIDKTPDELVAFCFLRKRVTREKFASAKRREAVAEQIRAFCDARGLTGMQRRQASARILSFLVHNGVMMHMGMI